MLKMATARKAYVVGVGMTKFEKPGRRPDFDYPEMTTEAVTKALADAGVSYDQIQQAAVGYCYGDTVYGQRALYHFGTTGIPIYNVNNACATGSTALAMARQWVEAGVADCVLAVGFEKMQAGPLALYYSERTNPLDRHLLASADLYEFTTAPMTPQLFGNAAREHMERYGTKPEHFAKIAWKNHKHSVNNPYSQFQKEFSMQEIMSSAMIHEPLTKLQCCPTSDGAAAAVIVSEDFVRRHHLEENAVEIVAQSLVTDLPHTFTEKSSITLVGFGMTKKAADDVFTKAGISREEVDVIELHDCFSSNELLTYEALGLCPVGKASEFIERGDNTYGGKYVINPSGGLISKGHPLGATGLAQCAELCWQLRGIAGPRQVAGAKIALQHNIGLGGIAVVTLYRRGFTSPSPRPGRDPTTMTNGVQFKSTAVFEQLAKQIEKDGGALVKKMQGVLCFKVKRDNEEVVWVIDLKTGGGSVKQDPQGKGSVTFTANDDDLVKILLGQINPQQAFLQGKMKVSGNMGLAMKLQQLKIEDTLSKL